MKCSMRHVVLHIKAEDREEVLRRRGMIQWSVCFLCPRLSPPFVISMCSGKVRALLSCGCLELNVFILQAAR